MSLLDSFGKSDYLLLNEPPERKTSKILNLQLQQVKVPKQIQNLLVSGITENREYQKKDFC